MTSYQYREATHDDIPRLLELEQNIVTAERPFDSNIKPGHVTYYDLDALVADEHTCLMVAESNGIVIGSGYIQQRISKACHTHEHHGYLGFIYIEPDHRGTGLSSGILNSLTDWGKKRGLRHFHLDVYADNTAAIRAYEKAGFQKASVNMRLIAD